MILNEMQLTERNYKTEVHMPVDLGKQHYLHLNKNCVLERMCETYGMDSCIEYTKTDS